MKVCPTCGSMILDSATKAKVDELRKRMDEFKERVGPDVAAHYRAKLRERRERSEDQ